MQEPQSPPATSDRALIERTYLAYFTVFQMGNPRAVTPYYHTPSVFLSAQGMFVLPTTHELEQFLGQFMHALRARGHARSVLTDIQVKQLSEQLALVNVRGERYRRDGELLEQVTALYTLRQVGGSWRIAAVTMYDPEHPLQLG
jgi:ketosteroid isomerase-like protein